LTNLCRLMPGGQVVMPHRVYTSQGVR